MLVNPNKLGEVPKECAVSKVPTYTITIRCPVLPGSNGTTLIALLFCYLYGWVAEQSSNMQQYLPIVNLLILDNTLSFFQKNCLMFRHHDYETKTVLPFTSQINLPACIA